MQLRKSSLLPLTAASRTHARRPTSFPGVTQWITEYNLDNQDLATTQKFYNMSSEYFDRLDSVARYSLFGSFRSKVSNVGPNAVMLDNAGKLTDIGAWYLGLTATGALPTSGGSPNSGAVSAHPSIIALVIAAGAFGLNAIYSS